MKARTKLIMSIMSICLVCAVFAIGVFALKTANLKIGGDVSFNATGVEADIINAKLSGTVADEGEGIVLATGNINTSMTQADIDTKFQNWQTLELDFNENGDDIVFKFDIANTSTNTDNYIKIDYDYSFTTDNPNVDVLPGDENAEKVWENNNYILTPKGSAETATYKTFTLKFIVIGKELNVKDGTKVNLTISLKHTTPKTSTATNNVVTIDNVKYTLNSPSAGFATVYTITEGYSVIIHPVVMSDAEGAAPCVVTNIGSDAFFGCDGLTTITIPNSVTSIGYYAFNGCTSLSSITIPNSVTSIGDYAFNGCSSLSSITIPNSVTSIGYRTFNGCSSLSSITIPNTVTNIGDDAFRDCSSLTTITIPNTVTNIGNFAFYDCSSLSSITISDSVTSIGNDAFVGCSALTSIVVASANSVYDSRNNCNAIIETESNTLLYGCQNTIIPNTVTIIRDRAFLGCEGLTTITIPSSVTSIRRYAFSGCSSLTSITIPSSVTSIGGNAFSSCTNLTSVKFEETTGWWYADSKDATSGTAIAEGEFTTEASQANAKLLTETYMNKYWFRTVS